MHTILTTTLLIMFSAQLVIAACTIFVMRLVLDELHSMTSFIRRRLLFRDEPAGGTAAKETTLEPER